MKVISEYALEHLIAAEAGRALDRGVVNDLNVLDLHRYEDHSKSDIAKLLGLVTWDTALPQNFVDAVYELTGENVSFHAVWCYDDGTGGKQIFGRPVPVTREGQVILKIYEHYNKSRGLE